MTDSVLVFPPGFRVLDLNGAPVNGAKIKFTKYSDGTDLTVYSDQALGTSLGATVYTRSDGFPVASQGSSTTVAVYIGTTAYNVEITDSNDVPIWPQKTNQRGALDTSSFLTSGSAVVQNIPVVATATDLTLTSSHKGKLINANGSLTLTLTAAATLGDAWSVRIRNAHATSIVKIVATENIARPEGATLAFALQPGEAVSIACDGAAFKTFGYVPPLFNTVGRILIADQVSAAPSSPTSGARYIVSGAFSTYSVGDIIEANGQGGFFKYTPPTNCGWIAYVQDEVENYQFQSSAWAKVVRAAVGAALVLIEQQTVASVATVDFDSGLDSTYDHYILVISNAKPATDDVEAWLRVGTGATPTWQTSGYKCQINTQRAQTNAATGTADANTLGQILLSRSAATADVGNATGENFNAVIRFNNPDASDFCCFAFSGAYDAALGEFVSFQGGGRYNTAGAITGVRFLFESGNIASGDFALYGMKRA